MATMHSFLRRHHGDMDPSDTVVYGPPTENQIERWWRDLHERMEKYYEGHLCLLKDQGHYDSHDDKDRLIDYAFPQRIHSETCMKGTLN
ncbi:hypothetical protein P5673_012245 [Acropora cervicornis]|uniref:Uncharacterized protein n=1 Tax=Acropora cervicornis TaxID=6130 RepID=A0AAD9QMH9_ACRCE|nr:hypothetical protein P5673_012245 [Acropora cervicornis]